jgi:RNA polymerase sigma factor (sigma-70 family)
MGESGDELTELIPIDEDISNYGETEEDSNLTFALDEVMNILDEREREIITQYYGLNEEELTLQQIAVKLKLTKERVRQIKNQAIKKLRFNAPLLFKFFQD